MGGRPKLIAAARCFLESFGEEDVQRMNLSQVSRALRISSTIARSALVGAELPPTPDAGLSPLQHQLLSSLARLYGQPNPPPLQPTPPSTLNHQPSPRSTDR